MSSRVVQQTLEGLAASVMPRVRTTDGHLLDWDREAIAKQLLKETKLSEQFYKEPGITEEEAQDIAKEVERRVRWMNVRYLSGPLVREIMNVVLFHPVVTRAVKREIVPVPAQRHSPQELAREFVVPNAVCARLANPHGGRTQVVPAFLLALGAGLRT